MTNINNIITFDEVADKVYNITKTENTVKLDRENFYRNENRRYVSSDAYSEYGFSSLGRTLDFPYNFVKKIEETNPLLAANIVEDRMRNYFEKTKSPFYIREFLGKGCGCVSSRYAYFDDNEVCDVIDRSPLKNLHYVSSYISPERLHLRALDPVPFKVDGDDSDHYFAFVVDNSMVGASSFKIQLGVWRQTCSNGMIIPIKEYVIYRQIHKRNEKNIVSIADEFNEAIELISEKKEEIKRKFQQLVTEKATIESLDEEAKQAYIGRRLNLSAKETLKLLGIYKAYTIEFGRNSKWALLNAVTEFARDLPNLERREMVERKALLVA